MSLESFIPLLLALVLSPLLPGIINRTKALFAGRRGPPLLQIYFDLWKLLFKGAIYSRTTTWVFRAGPILGLAAVLAADVAGYSRLMGRDEERTLTQLKTFRKTLVDPAIVTHRGRIVKTTGDGMLVEFASAVDAVRCAVEVQREMGKQNASVPQ